MQALKKYPFITSLLLLTACVTINVYFPAAAAESAADKIIEEVYGEEVPADDNSAVPDSESQSSVAVPASNVFVRFVHSIIPAAQAQQADINISTPGINKLKSLMKTHHQSLSPYYSSGAVGMESNGLIVVRDAKTIALKERNKVKKLVADENRDRTQLYEEIASANGHPEWETDIRQIFARRWIALAPKGWWYKDAGGKWQKK
ncbi:MAG: DUF1318 domain-containing protein [Gammaproteobacteria bacterium]|nr:DUF1318 domain-containing protein [Gammaproteobacteria bacterium]